MKKSLEENVEEKISKLRIVAKRGEDRDPYTVKIPVKGDIFSLVLPSGHINWPEGKPYPDSIKITIDETKNLWVNFGASKKHGFYSTLKISEDGRENE